MSAVDVEDLYKSYENVEILKGVNLKIAKAEFYTLMGPNGSGKTTLTSIIACTNLLTSGKIEILGYDISESVDEVKKLIGYIPQENFSSPYLTGRENLNYFIRLFGFSKDATRRLVDELLEKMGLVEDAEKRVSSYSGGMRKKLEVATALLPGIKILILDEPTTGLDPSARKEFLNMVEEINRNGTTILLVTHIGEDAKNSSRVGFMDGGRIILEGNPDDLKKQSGLQDVINIETSTKNQKISNLLQQFSNNGKILETERGYKSFCEFPEDTIPKIIRVLNQHGYKATRIEVKTPSLEDLFFQTTKKTLGRQSF